MPEGYTHIRTARQAAEFAGIQPKDPAAFGAGANGPDPLFCYQVWKPAAKRTENLPVLGQRLHQENTGAFLASLIAGARTPTQRSYVLGFLCHYATDCVMHPYVAAVTQPGQAYGMPGGHGYFEIALDSELHRIDTRDPAVRVRDNTPALNKTQRAEIAQLLQQAILEALGVKVSCQALMDSYQHTRLLRRMFVSRFGVKYKLFQLLEPMFGGKGFITGHVTPAKLKKNQLPAQWQNPYTMEYNGEGIYQLLEQAQRRSAGCMIAARQVWDGKRPLEDAMDVIGSNNYDTGLPDEESAPTPLRKTYEGAYI